MDLIDFKGRGVGEEMMKYLREFTETGATQELADMFPVLGAICSMNFQRTYKKIMDLFDKTSVVWAGVVQERRKRVSQTSMDAVDFVDALVSLINISMHCLWNYLERGQKPQLLQVNGCLWSS